MLGLASSGIHSNGFSLARKVVPENDENLWKTLLTPTRIYVKEILTLLESGVVLGAAHITGSGLAANIQRALPDDLVPRLSWDWPEPEVFTRIMEAGNIPLDEMRRVFNMGIGMALVTKKADAEGLIAFGKNHGIELTVIGEAARG